MSRKTSEKDQKHKSHYPPRDGRKTLIIIVLGTIFMLGIHFVLDQIALKADPSNSQMSAQEASQKILKDLGKSLGVKEEAEKEDQSQSLYNEAVKKIMPAKADIKPFDVMPKAQQKRLSRVWDVFGPFQPKATKPTEQIKQAIGPSVSPPTKALRNKIVIIIDDMGVNRKLSEEALDLPAPVTLAFLPYAKNLKSMTKKAKDNGHELMIHMPMEPINDKLDVGTIALMDDMKPAQIKKALYDAFKSFDGYVGINNHMGSRVTQNKHIMDQVMATLAEKDLFFVDSKTIGSSIAGDTAARYGLNYAERDVFLDHHDDDQFVVDSLQKVEQVARRKGYAIAIGHPKTKTIAQLKAWLPTLKEKGFEVVPVSAVVKREPNYLLSAENTKTYE